MIFEWSERKAAVNLAKHGVSFSDAATLFAGALALTFVDAEHSVSEERWLSFGVTADGRPVVVSNIERNGRVRIISARLMMPQERRQHERYR
jgi:hypothetical protein